ncbi:FHA domain-containing protein [Allonocardiopsis opalescens]|uniref:FHA domain-containing protein n=1 Tax=Allonocardiopsis opalescens TaxID=1144618 RepID=A0A2T0PVI8_9ACTN|nr:FHA domain-containing protein [Allonocardiopsis opalescens]PRX95517.1 FHA domain-containing protein [Allonocardiopsis opalescens]
MDHYPDGRHRRRDAFGPEGSSGEETQFFNPFTDDEPEESPAESTQTWSPPPPYDWGLRIISLDQIVEIPSSGLEIGRGAPEFRHMPGMAELAQISRQHARLYWEGRTLFLSDTGSSNGTYVDGRRIQDAEPVEPGQEIRLGLDVDVELVEFED